MKKHKNRIEIIGAYYLRIIIGRNVFESQDFYDTKSSAIRAAYRISRSLFTPDVIHSLNPLLIYDYNGDMPGLGNKNAKFKVLEI